MSNPFLFQLLLNDKHMPRFSREQPAFRIREALPFCPSRIGISTALSRLIRRCQKQDTGRLAR